jgi:UDP:flavonoid glycosyltransferase YjiC (YdhE family)
MTGVTRVGRSTVAFLNIAMHRRVNPTLPIVAELVRRGHSVKHHTSPAFSEAADSSRADG